MLLKKIINNKPSSPKLSPKKFYGKYLHALITHGPQMFRILSSISSNAEQEERTFNSLKTITSLTSNFHPEHVLLNCLIRLQVKTHFNSEHHEKESIVEKLSKGLPKKVRSIIPYWIIDEYPKEWQAHLENISCWKKICGGKKIHLGFTSVHGTFCRKEIIYRTVGNYVWKTNI